MGMSVKVPPPPPPPPALKDESDAVDVAGLMQQRALGQLGYKKTFLSGLRGPGGASLSETQAAISQGIAAAPATSTPPRGSPTTPPRDPASIDTGGRVGSGTQPAPPHTAPAPTLPPPTNSPRDPRNIPKYTPRR